MVTEPFPESAVVVFREQARSELGQYFICSGSAMAVLFVATGAGAIDPESGGKLGGGDRDVPGRAIVQTFPHRNLGQIKKTSQGSG